MLVGENKSLCIHGNYEEKSRIFSIIKKKLACIEAYAGWFEERHVYTRVT